jgi:hypothetical protein
VFWWRPLVVLVLYDGHWRYAEDFFSRLLLENGLRYARLMNSLHCVTEDGLRVDLTLVSSFEFDQQCTIAKQHAHEKRPFVLQFDRGLSPKSAQFRVIKGRDCDVPRIPLGSPAPADGSFQYNW